MQVIAVADLRPKEGRKAMAEMMRRPVAFFGNRLLDIWRDGSSWAELISSAAFCAYALALFFGKSPEEWTSLDLVTQLLPGWGWAILTACGGLIQLFALVLRVRFLRATAAMGGLLWIGGMCALVWPIFAWSPLLIMCAVQGALPNLMVIAKHARDW